MVVDPVLATAGLVATTTLLANVLPPDPVTVTFGATYATKAVAVFVPMSYHVLVLACTGWRLPLMRNTPIGFQVTAGNLLE